MSKAILGMVAVLCLVGSASAALLVDLPMDAQITHATKTTTQSPNGDAFYSPSFSDPDTMSFEDEGEGGFVRHHASGGNWWYQYADLDLAGIGAVDLSPAGAQISFDTRFFQHPQTNTNPYGDAPVFLRLYTYDLNEADPPYVGHRDYGIVYGVQFGDLPHPDWTTVVLNIDDDLAVSSEFFDVTNVTRVRFYGTDWQGGGDDFIDVRNLAITPEPTSLVLLGMAGLGLVMRRRR